MNDFTKEELEFIYNWLDWITKENYPLKNKLQSMIGNYCDHDWENICCQCPLDQIHCHKCNRSLGDK